MEDPGSAAVSCGQLTIPKDRKQLLVTTLFTWLDLPWNNPPDPVHFGDVCPPDWPYCHFLYDASVSTAGGNTLFSRSGLLVPPDVANWTCSAANYWTPNTLFCQNRTTQVIDVSSLTASDPVDVQVRLQYYPQPPATSLVMTTLSIYAGFEIPSVMSLRFYEDRQNQAGTSAVGMSYIDGATPIIRPEWQRDIKEKMATDQPYDEQTVAPVAYVSSSKLQVKAKFKAPDDWTSAVIKGKTLLPDGTPSPYGDLGEMTVQFQWAQDGYDPPYSQSDEVLFESQESANELGAYDVSIVWELKHVNYLDYWGFGSAELPLELAQPFEGRETVHRIYSLYKNPMAPMADPWAKVLDTGLWNPEGDGSAPEQ
jgi:hypothetical protein